MLRQTSFHKVFALVGPGLRARAWALLGVMLLAALATLGEKAPLMLLKPLMDRVLFPAQAEGALLPSERARTGPPGGADAAPSPPVGDSNTSSDALPDPSLVGALKRQQQRFDRWFFGAPGSLVTREDRGRVLWRVVAVAASLSTLAALAAFAFTRLSRWLALRMVIDLRLRLARHLLGLSMRYHGERSFGDLLSRIGTDVSATLAVVDVVFKDLTREPLLVLGSLGVAFAAAPLPTLVVLAALPLVIVPIALLGKRVKRRSRKSLTHLGASVQVLSQMFQGIRTVKAFRAEERELARYASVNEDYLKAAMKMVRALATIQGATTFLSQVGFMVVLLFVGLASIHWGMFRSSGEMLQFFGGIGMIYNHVKRITNAANSVQEAAGAADRLQQILDEPVELRERPGARPLENIGSEIAFHGVGMVYPGQAEAALRDVSLTLHAGETLALVGPSGAGKSTLVDLIARFIDPTSGSITVDGRDLRDVTLDAWTSLYAMVGQVPFLFHASILDNIRYGKPGASQAEVEEAARAANIHDFVAALPEGYGTIVGDAGSRLSGGQRQRITIARALLKGAPLLLLDEATSALDSESEVVVQEALERLMKGRTVVVIAHRLSTVRNADRIAVLQRGQVVEVGRHAELLARRGAYARLYEAQFATPAVGAAHGGGA